VASPGADFSRAFQAFFQALGPLEINRPGVQLPHDFARLGKTLLNLDQVGRTLEAATALAALLDDRAAVEFRRPRRGL
jgi:hypothetical protein